MAELILDSLEIRNYRGLEELRIGRLGRVNLIVGKNNVGKTSVLEALWLYSSPDDPELVFNLLESRDQFDPSSNIWKEPSEKYFLPLQRLFFTKGRNEFRLVPPTVIRIGVTGLEEDSLSISMVSGSEEASPFSALGKHVLLSKASFQLGISPYRHNNPRWLIHRNDPITSEFSHALIPSHYVPMTGLASPQVEALWDKIALSPLEDNVLEAIRLIAPDVERMAIRPIDEESNNRVPVVRLKGMNNPVHLRSLGDGMNRIFGIALALVNAKDGFLLIDEVENGLHYSVQPDIWRLIFQSAIRLNVQVFATTHSLDCIKAFEAAARESKEEGVLIRLAQKAGRILVGEFDERKLGIAVEGQIEVR